ncbi:SHOCT domain-containing protein [Streptomyces lydicamycinicus]|uniref:SHOCT domain-containing protein n=1 Tax=Streptomyces lydicamycinicus TaxID=1546107 RepID=UPI0020350ED9|nr:SHOCT domain-containing protein [Streptomyces lydicamycinicus]USA02076.1 SHOCT domain-containing protein [Streptomyces lydicamycinicus]
MEGHGAEVPCGHRARTPCRAGGGGRDVVLVRPPWRRVGLACDVDQHLPVPGAALRHRSADRPRPGPLGPRPRRAPLPRSGPPAEQILAERYARGEIDEEEYRRRLVTLRGAPPGGAPPGGAPPGGPSP